MLVWENDSFERPPALLRTTCRWGKGGVSEAERSGGGGGVGSREQTCVYDR